MSHHWRLPSTAPIPVLQNRLAHCFQNGISKAVEIPSVSWEYFYGWDLSDRTRMYINQRDDTKTIPIHQIRLGSREVFMILQKNWYVQKDVLFISDDISSTDLDLAIQFWLHEIDLRRVQSTVK